MDSFWEQVTTINLAQGDFLQNCSVPVVRADFDQAAKTPQIPASILVDEFDLIIMTQSCDLENSKAPLVACCPINTLDEFEQVNPRFKGRGEWERVRQGRIEGLHLLSSPTAPNNNRAALVVDFRQFTVYPWNTWRPTPARSDPDGD